MIYDAQIRFSIQRTFGEENTERLMGRISKMNPDLKKCIDEWVMCRETPFTCGEVSLDQIMKNEGKSYIEAVFSMQYLMEHPDLLAKYPGFRFGGV